MFLVFAIAKIEVEVGYSSFFTKNVIFQSIVNGCGGLKGLVASMESMQP